MTQDRDHPDERAALAAEHALRLLDGDERRRAQALSSSDPIFAGEAARWRGRLAPLFAETEPVAPPTELWSRIDAAASDGGFGDPKVVLLRRRVNAWRGATAAMSALAASLALVLVFQPRPSNAPVPQTQISPAAPLVAMLGDEQKRMKVVASWNPATRQLVLAIPGDMPADPDHAHELWVIPADGKPRSLGTMGGARQTHKQVADALARLLTQGATIAISIEPPGGSPSGAPTGPVVVSGALSQA